MGPARSSIHPWFWRIISTFFVGLLLLCPVRGRGQEPAATQASPRTDDWITVNKDYFSQRYVDLDQITPKNVGKLKEICEIQLNQPTFFSSGLLKIGRTLYINTYNTTTAFDATTCKLRWRKETDLVPGRTVTTNNSRGSAYLDGKIFRGTPDGRLIALDASTGEILWQNKSAANTDKAHPEAFVSAPIA
jgi:alcohol dehydrogenase (cytochrome c)